MTYKHLKYVHDLAFGRQSCLQRVRKLSVKVWHIPDSYNFVCGYNNRQFRDLTPHSRRIISLILSLLALTALKT